MFWSILLLAFALSDVAEMGKKKINKIEPQIDTLRKQQKHYDNVPGHIE